MLFSYGNFEYTSGKSQGLIKAIEVQHLGSEYAPATWDTAEKAQEWLDRHLASKKAINEWKKKKRNTWEVVEE